jgi:predicted negative regulator of RcsB-dependent stress response
MARLTRKEIKRDEFRDAVGRSVEYAESHVRTILYAVGGVVLLAAVAAAVYLYSGSRRQGANEALAEAMKVYKASIVATGAKPNDPEAPSFPTEAARRARAKELLEEVRDDYGMTAAADVAGLYLAQIAADEGRLDEARELWSDFVDEHGDSMLGSEARLNLIDLDRKQGKGEQVVKDLQAMLEKSDAPLPQDVILNELGKTFEHLRRTQEAVQSYQRIVDEFPQSPYRQEAQQRIAVLDPSKAPAGGTLPVGIPGFPG